MCAYVYAKARNKGLEDEVIKAAALTTSVWIMPVLKCQVFGFISIIIQENEKLKINMRW